MADMKLASGGDDVKLWDCGGYTELQRFNTHSANISSIAWSHDNVCLASASTAGDKIVLTYPDAARYSIDEAIEEGRTCISFNSSSRYIMGGGKDSMIHVWDLKTHKLKRTYKNHKGGITSLQFNWNDQAIASASEAGEIILYNVVTGIGCSPLVCPGKQSIAQIQYSFFKKSLLGSVSDDGAVSLWDTSYKRLVYTFKERHKSPATGLAFSPLNEMLLMSVGLDKRIVCYDVQGKSAVKTMVAESPLTSIDLFHDGSTLAVGSMRGKIFVYDLRQGADPVRTMAAHKSSVQGLAFQANAKNKAEVGGKPSIKSTSSGNKVPTSSQSIAALSVDNSTNNNNVPVSAGDPQGKGSGVPVIAAAKGVAEVRSSGVTSRDRSQNLQNNNPMEGLELGGDFEVFSPLRDQGSVPALGRQSTENRPEALGEANSSLNNFADGIFSPLNDPNHSRPPELNNVRASYERSSALPSSESPQVPINDDGPPYPEAGFSNTEDVLRDDGSNSNASQDSSFTMEDPAPPPSNKDLADNYYPRKTADNLHEQIPATTSSSSSSWRSHPPPSTAHSSKSAIASSTSKHPSSQTQSNSHQVLPTTPPEAAPSGGSGPVGGAEGGAPREAGGALDAIQPFQAQFFKNIVEEALDDVRDQVRQDILNMHMEMVKQFLRQQDEIRDLLQHYSINETLVAEVQRLKEENQQLKRQF